VSIFEQDLPAAIGQRAEIRLMIGMGQAAAEPMDPPRGLIVGIALSRQGRPNADIQFDADSPLFPGERLAINPVFVTALGPAA